LFNTLEFFSSEKLVTTGVLKNLISALPKTYHPLCDQIFRLLSTFIVNNDTPVIQEIKNTDHDLKKYVMKYYENEYNCGMDYSEEKAYCESILDVLKDKTESLANTADASPTHLDR